MRKDQNIAKRLRLRGKSYTEINRLLGIPKSTLAGWFSNYTISPQAQARINRRARQGSIQELIRRNKNQTNIARERAAATRQRAALDVGRLTRRDVFIIGVALYWAEGYKRPTVRHGREVTNHAVSLTNSDPQLVKIFIRFLRECCAVPDDKIIADLRIFPHQQGATVQRYWQRQIGLPLRNFRQIYTVVSISSRGKRPFNRLPFGVIQIRVANTPLFHTIMGYIEGIKKLV